MSLSSKITAFIAKSDQQGERADPQKLQRLNQKMGGIIPKWYIEAITTHPFCNLQLGWQKFEPEDDFDGIEDVQILNTDLLEEINCDSYPGIYLLPANYLVIGYGASWAGNCFVIPTDHSDDPPIYEVWHDEAHSTEELVTAIKSEAGGCEKVADKLSIFVRNAIALAT